MQRGNWQVEGQAAAADTVGDGSRSPGAARTGGTSKVMRSQRARPAGRSPRERAQSRWGRVACLAGRPPGRGVRALARGRPARTPNARWLTFETPNFQVVFHEGLDTLAFRAAERAEAALERLDGFGTRPPGRIQLVVSDHVDLSNGFASVSPYPSITIWARPPVDGPGAMPFDDWLELVVTHEVVHVLHLEMTSPLGRWARRILGRQPFMWPHFPGFFLPSWAVEGVAVAAESRETGGGRVHGARFPSILRARVLGGGGARLDQVMGPSPLFPGGDRPYAWGGLFFDHLVETEGQDAVETFFRRQAERLNPLRLDASARDAFGAPLTALHAAWVDTLRGQAERHAAQVAARALAPRPELLTEGARFALYPAFRPSDGALAWTRSDGLAEPAVVVEGAALAPLHALAPLAWGPGDTLWTTQPDFIDRYRVRGDVWRIAPDGTRAAVSRGLRATALDVHRESGRIVAVVERGGTNALVLVPAGGGTPRTLVPPDPGTHWMHPRWSPDASRVAVTRWRAGGRWEVGWLAVAEWEGAERALETAGMPRFHALDAGGSPTAGHAWTPDGRYLLWSSERSGVANLYGAAADGTAEIRQVTDLVTGGIFPAVSPDGGWIHFSLLQADGWELARIPLAPERWFAPLPAQARHAARMPGTDPAGPVAGRDMARLHAATLEGDVRPWTPWSTLVPRHWRPFGRGGARSAGARVLAPVLGLQSRATDAVGRHAWQAGLALPLSGPGRQWEGSASWQWAGLGNPVLTGRLEQGWEALGSVAPPEEGPLLHLASRERSVGFEATALRPGFRASSQVGAGLRLVRDEAFLLEDGGSISRRAALARPVRELAEATALVSRSSVRSHAFQPGPQEGTSAALRLRLRRETGLADSLRGVAGRDAGLREAVLSVRHFRPLASRGRAAAGGAPPVLALRGAIGVAGGPGAGPRTLRAGGGGGGGSALLGATWDRAPGVFQVRGYESGARSGSRAWGAGVELRIPLALVNRGWGALPVYLDRVAAGGFLDLASASGRGALPEGLEPVEAPGALLASAGLELVLAHGFGNWDPGLFRLGVAVPLRGDMPVGPDAARRPRPSVYAAAGWAF
jgi:hypothetical protein